MKSFLRIVSTLILAGSAAAHASTSYAVTVANDKPTTIHVAGTFALVSDTIGMYVTSSPQLEDGQAGLVRNLVARDSEGALIDTEYAGKGDWRLVNAVAGQVVEIEYDIALVHGDYDWGPGIDEVAYRQDDGLFFTGFSLFVVPGYESSELVTVSFDLPEGWRASTPWLGVDAGDVGGNGDSGDSGDQTFRAAGMMDLVRNCLFLGTHLEETVSLEDFTFVLALGGEFKAQKQLFVDAMAPLLPAYVEMFGGMPNASRYLVVINPGSRSDGGAFPGSYSMLIKGEVTRESAAVWGHGIAHELAHFWNGHTIAPASGHEEEWFKEGFTDYLTIVHLARSGLDPWQVTSRKLENMARRYIVAKRLMGIEDSMRAAGADKHKKRFLVYGGGALVAFALDVRIREATDNTAGLDDLMKAMYSEFGGVESSGARGRRYTFEDVVRLAGEVSGESQKAFFQSYVDGTEYLDVVPVFDAIGLRLTTMMDEFYLSERESATPAQKAMAVSIFGE